MTELIVFYLFAAMTVISAIIVVWSKRIIYSAFSLLVTFIGVAGLYILLSADFLAVIQVLVYVGGILILILFAVMFTQNISEVKIARVSIQRWLGVPLSLLLLWLIIKVLRGVPWKTITGLPYEPTTARIGEKLLGPYLLPFEIASVILLAVLIGAVYIGRKEVRDE